MPDNMPRNPRVFLFVILPLLSFGGLAIGAGMIEIYAQVYGVPPSAVPDLNGILISIPALFIWLPVSLLLANWILKRITPLRRIAERYVATRGRPGYVESQKLLLKASIVVLLICLPLIVLGFLL